MENPHVSPTEPSRMAGPSTVRVVWRDRERGEVAIAPVCLPGAVDPDDVRATVAALADAGARRIRTPPLQRADRDRFEAAGFNVHQELQLLRADVREVPARPSSPPVHRGRRHDWPAVLAVDEAAFGHDARFEEYDLADAMTATPVARLRLTTTPHFGIAGFTVAGVSGGRGYLQRLAVAPAHQREGHGRALVIDALRWFRRRGARDALVNTQPDNLPALELYRGLGFETLTERLTILDYVLGPPPGGDGP